MQGCNDALRGQYGGTFFNVLRCTMMLCPVVAQVAFAGGPIETKLTLSFMAA
jgi:hypothetical protein